MNKVNISAIKLAVFYAIFASLWILFSDFAVEILFDSNYLKAIAQTYKGLAFVVITALLLLLLVRRENLALEKANDMDRLTGLLSINMFIRTLNSTIRQMKPGKLIVLGYLDIDDFKSINDAIGFEQADRFLQDIANDIKGAVSTEAFLSRLQADQFACFNILDESIDMDSHIRNIHQQFLRRAKKNGIDSTCCIGVALFPTDGSDAKELMVSATKALHIAKQQKNAIQFHDKVLTERAMQRRQMFIDLQEAIVKEELSVVYQPKYNLQTLTTSGVEVLVRWNHPTQGFIPPDVFIPLAEENGLVSAVSKLVVAKASAELGHSAILGNQLKHIAINVSAVEFNNNDEMDELTKFIKDQVNLAPYIRIEITETATLSDMNKSVEIISSLQASGISLSIDDFGTGYTSLAMLKDLTVDEIKIDRSFVAGVEHDHRAKTIVNAIIAMAKSFNINVVAEGIETEQQLKVLQEMDCQEAQGYYLGRPMPLDELINHVTT